ncbi:MAG: hypothetical protein MSJ26_01325 [Oscillospiraceae bacterium]|nr:hypothetical protein [Oscillospiraceae bacterium]
MRRLFKAAVSFFAASVIAVCLSAGASAYAGNEVYKLYGFDKNEISLAKLIKSTLENFVEEEVDISKYNVSYDEFEEIFAAVMLNEPTLHYVDCTQVSLSYKTTDHIMKFKPLYHCTFFELDERNEMIEKFSKSVMSGVKSRWSDEEKILYIHDCLAAHITYYNGDDVKYGRNIYDAFAEGSSVCVGYSLGFQYFMDKLGIPCVNVTTPDHIWNMVCVDGQWYHVDITWDDSVEVTQNTVFHDSLLQSEESMTENNGHDIADKAMEADDSFFANAFWTESSSVIRYLNGYWYYTNLEGLNRYSFETGESKLIYSIDDVWYSGKDSVWKTSFSRTAVSGKSIYFNSADTIYRYDTSKNKVYKVYSPKLSGGEQIFDIYISGSKLVFGTGSGSEPVKTKRAIRLKAS